MSNRILISPKHGVNPTIPICFWCGKEKNEIALLGKMKGDMKAPMNCILDYEPCDECKSYMEQGITLISVTRENSNSIPPIQNHLYPTGTWAVIKKDAVSDIFPEDIAEQAITTGKLLVDQSIYSQLIPSV